MPYSGANSPFTGPIGPVKGEHNEKTVTQVPGPKCYQRARLNRVRATSISTVPQQVARTRRAMTREDGAEGHSLSGLV